MSLEELRAVYESLPSDVSCLIIKDHLGGNEIFWRKPIIESEPQQKLCGIQGLAGLTISVALVREAIMFAQEDLFKSRMAALYSRFQLPEQEIEHVISYENMQKMWFDQFRELGFFHNPKN
jgi:hypothetical protein